ncbi:hypothetical protein MRX96_039576 [Rhipicephalus microplus]
MNRSKLPCACRVVQCAPTRQSPNNAESGVPHRPSTWLPPGSSGHFAVDPQGTIPGRLRRDLLSPRTRPHTHTHTHGLHAGNPPEDTAFIHAAGGKWPAAEAGAFLPPQPSTTPVRRGTPPPASTHTVNRRSPTGACPRTPVERARADVTPARSAPLVRGGDYLSRQRRRPSATERGDRRVRVGEFGRESRWARGPPSLAKRATPLFPRPRKIRGRRPEEGVRSATPASQPTMGAP